MVALAEMTLVLSSRTSTNDPKLRILNVCIYLKHAYTGFVSRIHVRDSRCCKAGNEVPLDLLNSVLESIMFRLVLFAFLKVSLIA